MAKAVSKVVSLYLTDWQIRMVRDVLGVECHVWDVDFGKSVLLYGVFPPQDTKAKKMYLAEWQMSQIRDEVGATCHYIELKKGIVLRYRVPVVKDTSATV
jgi:hypothetical protein